MKVKKLEVMINKKGYKLHLHDIKKLSKVLLFKTPKLPKFYEDDDGQNVQQKNDFIPTVDVMED